MRTRKSLNTNTFHTAIAAFKVYISDEKSAKFIRSYEDIYSNKNLAKLIVKKFWTNHDGIYQSFQNVVAWNMRLCQKIVYLFKQELNMWIFSNVAMTLIRNFQVIVPSWPKRIPETFNIFSIFKVIHTFSFSCKLKSRLFFAKSNKN